jgi:septal ring-binding cell division protein DamX
MISEAKQVGELSQDDQIDQDQGQAKRQESSAQHQSETNPHAAQASQQLQWLERQNETNFTVQLIGASERQSVANYAAEHELDGATHIIETRRQGEPWFILLYGNHEDRAAANKSIEQLPADVRSLGPWTRSFSSIEKSIDEQRRE